MCKTQHNFGEDCLIHVVQSFLAPLNKIFSRLVFIKIKTSKVLIFTYWELFPYCKICTCWKWNPFISNPAIHESCEFTIRDTPQETKGKIIPVLNNYLQARKWQTQTMVIQEKIPNSLVTTTIKETAFMNGYQIAKLPWGVSLPVVYYLCWFNSMSFKPSYRYHYY